MTRNALIPRREDFFFPLEQTFNKFFDDFFSNDRLDTIKGVGSYPKMNAYVHNNELIMHVSVPGLKAEDVKAEVTPENTLVVSGKMSEEYSTPKDAKLGWRHELRQSAFERHFQLPDYVEGDPEARLKDGILTLRWKTKYAKQLPEGSGKKLIPIKSE